MLAGGSNGPEDIRAALSQAVKDAQNLWEENRDLQGRFVNDLGELQRIQMAIGQLESEQRSDQLQQARQSMQEMQRRASQLYEMLIDRRAQLTTRLNNGLQFVAMLQNSLISERLFNWKNQQKLAQVGFPFENRDQCLDEIQKEFEFLAEQNWQLRTFACYQHDFVKRGPQLNDNNAQTCAQNISAIMDQLSKLLCMLVSQSFVVTVQPDPVLKTQHKFGTEVRLLIGDTLGIRQNLVNTNVTVKIIAEEDAKLLSTGQLSEKDIKTVGSISNDFEKMMMDEKGHMAAKFNNSKLTRIAHRKQPPRSAAEQRNNPTSAATDQKYALLFHISPFQLGNLGKFDVWTMSLPLMVTVHGSQDCDAQGAILWQRAFSTVNRAQSGCDIQHVAWQELGEVIRYKFSLFTGARRPLSDSDLNYLYEKFFVPNAQDIKPITFNRFAKERLRDDVNFSFWEWLFSIMQLIKQKLLKFWDEGWCIGFISKQGASDAMHSSPEPTFLLRFSDTQTGAVSIGFVCDGVPFHLAPFSIKDLEQLSLAQRIVSCPQLKDIRYLFGKNGNVDKEEMLKYFESEERHKAGGDSPTTGYILSEIIMVANTSGRYPNSFGTDSPSPLSAHSRLDWSPGEVIQPLNSMEISDYPMAPFDGREGGIEALLGGGFQARLPDQPLQPIDLSIFETFQNQQNFHAVANPPPHQYPYHEHRQYQ
ncbi:unnamed protein product, partial [Mesorhabditis belari]|uniref:Signal transducer and activator of transcription n=1 Tax=Mesorhabditis belari TaxID=2138241 RepID=A0AAF3FNJ6_9BILA